MIDEDHDSAEIHFKDNIFGISLGKMKAIHEYLGHWIEKIESKKHTLHVLKNLKDN